MDNKQGKVEDKYLDKLIKQSAPDTARIGDPEQWLREVRGYTISHVDAWYALPGGDLRVLTLDGNDYALASGEPGNYTAYDYDTAALHGATRLGTVEEYPTSHAARARAGFLGALYLLRELYDLQNGPPLERLRARWESCMSEVSEFLRENENREI